MPTICRDATNLLVIDRALALVQGPSQEGPRGVQELLKTAKRVQRVRKSLCAGAGVGLLLSLGLARFWRVDLHLYSGAEIIYHVRLGWLLLPLTPIQLAIAAGLGRCAGRRAAALIVWAAEREGLSGKAFKHYQDNAPYFPEFDLGSEAFSSCTFNNNDALNTLASANPDLRVFGVRAQKPTKQILETLASSAPELTALRFYGPCAVSGFDLEALQNLTRLEELVLRDVPNISPSDLTALQDLHSLRKLVVGAPQLGAGTKAALEGVEGLCEFELISEKLPLSEFGSGWMWPNLRRFTLDTKTRSSSAEDVLNALNAGFNAGKWQVSSTGNRHTFFRRLDADRSHCRYVRMYFSALHSTFRRDNSLTIGVRRV